jgi:hypothetical protein
VLSKGILVNNIREKNEDWLQHKDISGYLEIETEKVCL